MIIHLRISLGEKNREQNEIKKMLKRHRIARRFNVVSQLK